MKPSKKLKPALKPEPLPTQSWSFEAIGSQWWLGIFEPCSDQQLAVIQQAINDRIEQFDATYSRFRPDSLVTQIAQKADRYTFPDDAAPLFTIYRQLYDLSDGLVTPLIGQTLADAGYDADYRLVSKPLSPPPGWDDVMELSGTTLTTNQPLLLDFGAAGKGYLVDILCELLIEHGITHFCLDGSGDLRAVNLDQPLAIGLENPLDVSQVIGTISLQNGALCSSAGNRRAWANYHHILSPKTLQSPRQLNAVWVSANTTLEADALTTALYFLPPQKLLPHFTFDYLLLNNQQRVAASTGFGAQLFVH